jgi:hypothetical protein
MPRLRAAGPEQNRTTGPPAAASWKGRPRAIPHPGRSSRPRNPDAHPTGLRSPQTNMPPSGEKHALTMMRTKTGAPRTSSICPFRRGLTPGFCLKRSTIRFAPSPPINPSRSRSPNVVPGAVPDQTRTYLCFTLSHCAFVRLTLLCDVGSGPMRPISAPWKRHTLPLANAGRLRLPETVRTWLASR